MKKRLKFPEGLTAAHIINLSHEGRGIATIEGRKTFISNALPDEDVIFQYTALQPRYGEGRAIEILNASPERVAPECPHFSICGGCSLQHMEHSAQLTLKQNTLLEQLHHFAKQQPDTIMAPITGPQYAYRHKARLGVRYVPKKNAVLVGFREQQSRYLTDLNLCKVLANPVGNLITPLRELIRSLAAFEQIAQIEVAIGDTQSALVFRNLVTLNDGDQHKLIDFAKQHTIDLYLQSGGPNTVTKIWPLSESDLLYYTLPNFDLQLWFHPLDFIQINPAINRKMIPVALNLLELKPTDKVLDLFCGLGNFTLPIARTVQHVTGVEGSQLMVKRAQHNAAANNINNVEFHMADLTQPVTATWAKQRYDKLLLDPGRAGAKEIIEMIPCWQPERIVYVSCNPATLARDAGLLAALGYHLQSAGIIDMFPQTNHVESIANFIRI
jgi:23S rRNA (uracil1939-C5)-methyltransferase